ncbi:hypothetical protein [Secundilactobacillus silagei]|uniref:hypothetical protein n=1 Tax=Secundilactobacillus silagei TaxID=1293415 RepID=UPI0006D25D73|nr:hypothetical protein [Secundilactobacillus silagei]
MSELQNKEAFVQNLKINNPDLNDLVSKTEFHFKDSGKFAYYCDGMNHAWNQKGLIVIIETTQTTIQKWKNMWKNSSQYLKSVFTDALDVESMYDVVDLNFKIVSDNEALELSDDLLDMINEISTRDALFTSRTVDEKLELLNDTIERMLKKGKKFAKINDDDYFHLLTNENIKKIQKTNATF